MAKHFVRTQDPVNEEQIKLLRLVGIDVSQFASKQIFWGDFQEAQLELLASWEWVECVAPDVQFSTCRLSNPES